ncbi:hypothetical protein LZ575_17585 [Antarcticibacterium sp. 1MA-6-2]|uniref:hypothetical protein n=1 Tax=Antarcticibacterium sp. 1MA-6-2 TaxID=2908210 RepID=UPI001F41B028|nr:hypothetical protein [Antarcticibacterium sp. 1MA-6-2]UJH90577.1 hypothetical protein LZ575_17585 [Antarcticibacterium sp. 1MA-6-2]
MSHNDRFVRYAARIAIEHQPVSKWQARALNEKDPRALSQAIIALARHSQQNPVDEMLQSLISVDYGNLSEQEQQDLLRAFEIVLFRKGNPALKL